MGDARLELATPSLSSLGRAAQPCPSTVARHDLGHACRNHASIAHDAEANRSSKRTIGLEPAPRFGARTRVNPATGLHARPAPLPAPSALPDAKDDLAEAGWRGQPVPGRADVLEFVHRVVRGPPCRRRHMLAERTELARAAHRRAYERAPLPVGAGDRDRGLIAACVAVFTSTPPRARASSAFAQPSPPTKTGSRT
jgi:hypothetical protein